MTKIDIVSVNHVCLVVRSMEAADAFYVGIVGLQPHHRIKSWLVLNSTCTLHLLHIPAAGSVGLSPRLVMQHFALQVGDLRDVLVVLLQAYQKPFQMDVRMTEHLLTDTSDPLTFGTGTLFVRDPDGNLIEFIGPANRLFSVNF